MDTVIAYPDLLQEGELFTNPHQLRDYSIAIHAIQSESMQSDGKVVFGLVDEANQNEYYVAWEVSLSSLLFGPSEMIIPQTGSRNQEAQYKLIFQNYSSRVNDYNIIIRSIKLFHLPSSTYSYSFLL